MPCDIVRREAGVLTGSRAHQVREAVSQEASTVKMAVLFKEFLHLYTNLSIGVTRPSQSVQALVPCLTPSYLCTSWSATEPFDTKQILGGLMSSISLARLRGELSRAPFARYIAFRCIVKELLIGFASAGPGSRWRDGRHR
jgi:hypothetical protein